MSASDNAGADGAVVVGKLLEAKEYICMSSGLGAGEEVVHFG